MTSHAVQKSGSGYCVEIGLYVDMSEGGRALWSSRWQRGGQLGGALEGECDLGREGEDHGCAWSLA